MTVLVSVMWKLKCTVELLPVLYTLVPCHSAPSLPHFPSVAHRVKKKQRRTQARELQEEEDAVVSKRCFA